VISDRTSENYLTTMSGDYVICWEHQ